MPSLIIRLRQFRCPSARHFSTGRAALYSHKEESMDDFVGEDDFANDNYKAELLSDYYDGIGPKYIKLAVRWSQSIKSANLAGLKEKDKQKFYLHGLWPIPRKVLTHEQLIEDDLKLSGSVEVNANFFKIYGRQILKLWPDRKNPACLVAAKSFIIREWRKHGKPAGMPLRMYIYHGLAMISALPTDFGIPVGEEMKLSDATNYARETLKNMHLFGEHIGANVAPEIRAVFDRDDTSRPFVIEEVRVHLTRSLMNGNGVYRLVDVASENRYTGKANSADNIVILPSKR